MTAPIDSNGSTTVNQVQLNQTVTPKKENAELKVEQPPKVADIKSEPTYDPSGLKEGGTSKRLIDIA